MPTMSDFKNMLDIINILHIGPESYSDYVDNTVNCNEEDHCGSQKTMIEGFAQSLHKRIGKLLLKKQYIPYKVICCLFLPNKSNEIND